MGLLNDIWWVMGLLMAARVWYPGLENALAGNYPIAGLFFVLGLVALFLPEYIRWRLLGGNSPFERVPVVGARVGKGSE